MTVYELIQKLLDLPPTAEVVCWEDCPGDISYVQLDTDRRGREVAELG